MEPAVYAGSEGGVKGPSCTTAEKRQYHAFSLRAIRTSCANHAPVVTGIRFHRACGVGRDVPDRPGCWKVSVAA